MSDMEGDAYGAHAAILTDVLVLAKLLVAGEQVAANARAREIVAYFEAREIESKRLADERAKEDEERDAHKRRRAALRAEHLPGLKKLIREAAKHLNGNASRLGRVASVYQPGSSFVGSSFSGVVESLAENLIGLGSTGPYAHDPRRGHPPKPEEVERMLARIRAYPNAQERNANGERVS